MAAEAWGFMKEISSDGDVSTVDVIYPAFPFFAKLAPDFFRRIILPLLTYANNGTAAYGLRVEYNLTWAPHHLAGPLRTGQCAICHPRARSKCPWKSRATCLS